MIEKEPSPTEGIIAVVVTLLAFFWVIMALMGEAPVFFTLFGVWVGLLSGREALRYLQNRFGQSKNASDQG